MRDIQFQFQRGFSFIEVMLSVAIITALATLAIPVYRTLQIKNDLDIAAQVSVQSVRRAQLQAQSSDGDTSWGLKVASGAITVFKGTSYAARDTTYDETYDLPTSITPSGVTEIVFAKFTGLPNTSGNLVLTPSSGVATTVVINAKGFASY